MKSALFASAVVAMAFSGSADAATMRQHHGSKHVKQVVADQPKERLGTLQCEVAGGIGMVIGSNRKLQCSFKQRSGKIERYVGTIGRLGVDVGVTGKRYLSWLVVNTVPTRVGDGALAGRYVGASAGASVGLGLGANALVGGSSKNFALQPISAEGGVGLNIAAGIAQLKLQKAG
ncbi:DUF992 domain-containing protein [Rhizobium sp. BK696]|uniref:DUF992 domain-containing protein n=1 Tax=Rhizobium sp. Rhizsp82 TaxID=3243057 RepID=UPI000DDB8153